MIQKMYIKTNENHNEMQNYQNYLIFNSIYNINLEYKSSITIITDFVQ
jgi:hypothetical protein